MSTGIGIGIAGNVFQTRAGLASGGGGASLLLDQYGADIAAAYSVRKLRNAYSGSAFRVRRDSDNSEQDIGFDSNGNLDESALTAFVGANNGYIVKWYDQTTNGNNATQTAASRQLRVVSSGTIDKLGTKVAPVSNVVRVFYIPDITIAVTPPQTSIAVIKSSQTSGTSHFISENLATGTYRFSGHDDFLSLHGGSAISASGISQAHMVAVGLCNGASSYIRANGSEVTTGNTSGNNYSINRVFGDNATNNFKGNMQEILIYTADKSTDIAAIETDINTYYSIYP
jgi:hypothetical protein